MTAFCGDVPIQIMSIKIIVLTEYNPSGSRPNFFGRQHLTFDKGRAWMPEVERPEFRKDAKPTERSYGKSDSVFRGIVRSGGHGGVMWSLLKHYALLPDTILTSAEN